MLYLISPIERHLRRHLTSERNRQRFDRAKRFVDETMRRGEGDEMAHRVNARWLKFLCSRTPVQRDIWPKDADFLRHFATVFGLPPAATREFIGLSLLGRLWRAGCFDDLAKGPPELVARLTRVTGWEHFDRCRRDGAGLILLPVHGQFSRLFQPYLRHRGSDGLEVGITNDKGRQRRIAAGFAELALKTGAHVMPIAYRFSPRGFFVLEFGAPFHVLGPQSSHDERVDSLIGQYANFLRDEWRLYPWNIHWEHLRYYCELPEVDPGALGAKVNAPRPSEAISGGAREGFVV